VHPNPAFQTNTSYTILIKEVKLIHPTKMDGMEDISVKLVREEEFSRMIANGEITHALVVVADLWRRLWRSGAITSSISSSEPSTRDKQP